MEKRSSESQLREVASRGVFDNTFRSSSPFPWNRLAAICQRVSTESLCNWANISWSHPITPEIAPFLFGSLYLRDPELWEQNFCQIVKDPTSLLSYAKMARSGDLGKKLNISNVRHRRTFRRWFEQSSPEIVIEPQGFTYEDFSRLSHLPRGSIKSCMKPDDISPISFDKGSWLILIDASFSMRDGSLLEDAIDVAYRWKDTNPIVLACNSRESISLDLEDTRRTNLSKISLRGGTDLTKFDPSILDSVDQVLILSDDNAWPGSGSIREHATRLVDAFEGFDKGKMICWNLAGTDLPSIFHDSLSLSGMDRKIFRLIENFVSDA